MRLNATCLARPIFSSKVTATNCTLAINEKKWKAVSNLRMEEHNENADSEVEMSDSEVEMSDSEVSDSDMYSFSSRSPSPLNIHDLYPSEELSEAAAREQELSNLEKIKIKVPGIAKISNFPSSLSEQWLRTALSVYASLLKIHLQPESMSNISMITVNCYKGLICIFRYTRL